MRKLSFVLACWCLSAAALGEGNLHALWKVHGKHNTVYIMGSIHVLRQSDYPLAPVILKAYGAAQSIYMEVNLQELDSQAVQAELMQSALMPEDEGLPAVLGKERYAHACALAHEVGVELPSFDRFAPWFAAEAISQLQLMHLGFQSQSGVEAYFLERARADGKSVAGLETLHDQIALFENMPLEAQAAYLLTSLQQARELPKEVDEMVRAWRLGDTRWFTHEIEAELGDDPQLYQAILVARNRKWLPKIEALLDDDKNYLVIVGTGHLVGSGSVIDLLKKDGIGASQL